MARLVVSRFWVLPLKGRQSEKEAHSSPHRCLIPLPMQRHPLVCFVEKAVEFFVAHSLEPVVVRP
jgi:hypothetical protein